MNLLKFGKGNAKLDNSVYTFSLPAGWTCPHADICLSKANRETGKIKDGEATEFRCFSASEEALLPTVRKARWHNFDLLKSVNNDSFAMTGLILDSLPAKAKACRIHVSGDFFSQTYFNAWMMVADSRPKTLFYAYTKSLTYWVNDHNCHGSYVNYFTPNMVLTASFGGRYDYLIADYGLRSARVVFSRYEAKKLGLAIDHDDSHAMTHSGDFALLLHGVQPAGSKAAKRWASLKKQGEGYRAEDRKKFALPVIGS